MKMGDIAKPSLLISFWIAVAVLIFGRATEGLENPIQVSVDFCKTFSCGKGTCKNTTKFPFVECDCDEGWKRVSSDSKYAFLPCTLPDCSLNYSCADSSAPSPAPASSGISIFDPCSMAVCGGGTCERKSNMTYSCNCKEGFYNLMNWTYGYCVASCQLGGDCTVAGINSSSFSPAPAAGSVSDDKSGGFVSTWTGKKFWIFLVAAFLHFLASA